MSEATFAEFTVTGQADAIISGDRGLLDLTVHEGIPVLSPARFLHQHLRESGS